MRRVTIPFLFLFSLMFVSVALKVNVTHANPMVYTAKEDGTITDKFDFGEKVRIIAYSADPLPYDIIVIDSDGIVRFTDQSTDPNYDKIIGDDEDGITDKYGWWEVKAGTSETHYAIGLFQVVPEVPLGTIATASASFFALGIKLFRRKQHT